jgi:hypothetical protein
MIAHLKSCKNAMGRYIAPSRLLDSGAIQAAVAALPVERVLEHYHFVGVQERFDESILVLRHRLNERKLNVSLKDVLYIRTKDSRSGLLDDTNRAFVPHMPLASQGAAVRAYYESDFKAANAKDGALWDEANRRLDDAVKRIPGFQSELAQYRSLLRTANRTCGVFPGSKRHGSLTSLRGATVQRGLACYWNDNGCAYSCLDDLEP